MTLGRCPLSIFYSDGTPPKFSCERTLLRDSPVSSVSAQVVTFPNMSMRISYKNWLNPKRTNQ